MVEDRLVVNRSEANRLVGNRRAANRLVGDRRVGENSVMVSIVI